ncbi:hypothetical protein M407DRAFT_202820 [Tulasnella calospora MUT 4182]|uniref:Transcription elongation factor 1 homolog n=1 Tax=Tulasnella calospora MUT 4182 TaxID=1051891 RepID=A0A0C3Q8R5_9AGAM|nr:hypothetical protein M407DRAFT_202820 [Tulasnella calospora MUT 4182]
MGKRKSSKKPQGPKRRAVLDTTFTCLYCHHENAITCKLDKKESVGHLNCKICGQSFQCAIHHLSEPIDVYSEWIDAAEEAQATQGGSARRGAGALSDDE